MEKELDSGHFPINDITALSDDSDGEVFEREGKNSMLAGAPAERRQYGRGDLIVDALPVEDTSGPTPRLIWTGAATLTCQTPLGRNLELRNWKLYLWRDARVTFTGKMFNFSRHSDWLSSFSVEVWFRSGHPTRPEARDHLGSISLSHGKSTQHQYRQYSDDLARLYDEYRKGELLLKLTISASRTN